MYFEFHKRKNLVDQNDNSSSRRRYIIKPSLIVRKLNIFQSNNDNNNNNENNNQNSNQSDISRNNTNTNDNDNNNDSKANSSNKILNAKPTKQQQEQDAIFSSQLETENKTNQDNTQQEKEKRTPLQSNLKKLYNLVHIGKHDRNKDKLEKYLDNNDNTTKMFTQSTKKYNTTRVSRKGFSSGTSSSNRPIHKPKRIVSSTNYKKPLHSSESNKTNNQKNSKFKKCFNFITFNKCNKKTNNNSACKSESALNNKADNDENLKTICLPIVQFDAEGDMPIEKKILKDDTIDGKYRINDTTNNYEKYSHSNLSIDHQNVHLTSSKLKYYIKVVLKFAFSQIGLAGLVIGYVILGSLIFMKIESSYEKHQQEKNEINREVFYRDVRNAAEHIVNEYLSVNFHYKYNQYRNEEMNGNLFLGTEISNNIIEKSPNSMLIKALMNNVENNLDINSNNETNSTTITNSSVITTSTISSTSKKYKYIKEKILLNEYSNNPNNLKNKKNTWHIKIDEDQFRKEISHYLKVFLNENEKIEDKDKTALLREEVWTYSSALLYSATVITTIGYGNITPKSNIGKIFTMVYAMIGIPLMFMCLTNTGDLLAELFINVYSKTIRFFYRRLCRHKLKMLYSSSKFDENKREMLNDFEVDYDNPNDRHVPIVATIGVLSGYIFTGAVIFSYWENWSYLDGAYFCFITFTTIGFGDFVPGKNTLSTDKGGKAALCTLYLLAGMIIMAMCFKLMQDEVFSKARWIGKKLGIIDKN